MQKNKLSPNAPFGARCLLAAALADMTPAETRVLMHRLALGAF